MWSGADARGLTVVRQVQARPLEHGKPTVRRVPHESTSPARHRGTGHDAPKPRQDAPRRVIYGGDRLAPAEEEHAVGGGGSDLREPPGGAERPRDRSAKSARQTGTPPKQLDAAHERAVTLLVQRSRDGQDRIEFRQGHARERVGGKGWNTPQRREGGVPARGRVLRAEHLPDVHPEGIVGRLRQLAVEALERIDQVDEGRWHRLAYELGHRVTETRRNLIKATHEGRDVADAASDTRPACSSCDS